MSLEASPPPSWYEKPEYVDCIECGRPVDALEESDVCSECIAEIKAEDAYDRMIDQAFDSRAFERGA